MQENIDPVQQPSILDEAEASGQILESFTGPFPNYISADCLKELKHSIRTHLMIMAGPSQQLCAYLTKLLDFFEDADAERRNKESNALSFAIIEGVALFVQNSIDERGEKAKALGQEFPQSIRKASDNIMILVGQSRSLEDKIVAKYAVLRAMAEALRALSSFTKAAYPELFDSAGHPL